jgi:lipopolysaccharide assembly LapA-like protein
LEVDVLRRILRLLVGLPIVIVAVAIGLANTQRVRLSLDPFRPEEPALSLELPLYAWLLGALFCGVIGGGLAMWLTQTRWRRSARRSEAETQRWKAEAERRNPERQREPSRQLT